MGTFIVTDGLLMSSLCHSLQQEQWMNVCVGDIIKLENNQFVAVRDKVSFRSAGLPVHFGRKGQFLPGFLLPLNTHGKRFSQMVSF